MRKTKTAIHQAYFKERRRIQSAIRRLSKRGYFQDSQVLPSIPKKVTKASVSRLKKLTIDVIYKKSRKVDFETGELMSGVRGRDLERAERSRKAARTRALKKEAAELETISLPDLTPTRIEEAMANTIISNFRYLISGFNERAQKIVYTALDRLIQENGLISTSQALEAAANAGNIWDYRIAYDESLLYNFIDTLVNFLPDQGQLYRDEFMEALEEEEVWEEF